MKLAKQFNCKLGSECLLTGPEPACGISAGISVKAARGWMNREHKEILAVHNRTQTAKGISVRNLCQKDQGTAETK
jgi:hypothetical protein